MRNLIITLLLSLVTIVVFSAIVTVMSMSILYEEPDYRLTERTRFSLHTLNRDLEKLSYISVKLNSIIYGNLTKLNYIPNIRPLPPSVFNRQLDEYSGFGVRLHPIFGVKLMHSGIDIGAPVGTPVYAAGAGYIESVRHLKSGYGNFIVIVHCDTQYSTLYAHLNDILVDEGDYIRKGQHISTVGNTGTSLAPHLHYEVRLNGLPIDPIPFMYDTFSESEYEKWVYSVNNI